MELMFGQAYDTTHWPKIALIILFHTFSRGNNDHFKQPKEILCFSCDEKQILCKV